MWTPDAYEGAPTIVTAFMSTGVKAAAFGAFVRVFLSTLEPMQGHWMPVLGVIAGATMILGAVLGVLQNNVKRMLAYSSIAHAGYLLLGIVAANSAGKGAVLFYLLTYAIANMGALGIVALLGTAEHPHDELRDFAGLWKTRPGLAGLMTVFLLSLGGFPPTAGFIAKWYIFSAAVQEGHYSLAIIGVLSSVVSVFFYLRIVVMMYMTEEPSAPARPAISVPAMVALAFVVLATFYLGVLPNRVLEYAMQSIQTIVVMMYMTEEPEAPARPAISVPAMVALGFVLLATFYLGVMPNRVPNSRSAFRPYGVRSPRLKSLDLFLFVVRAITRRSAEHQSLRADALGARAD